MVLVLDSDVPWIPANSRPDPQAAIFHIDTDPLKQQMPLWYIHVRRSWRADIGEALAQLNAAATDAPLAAARRVHWAGLHAQWIAALQGANSRRATRPGGVLGPYGRPTQEVRLTPKAPSGNPKKRPGQMSSALVYSELFSLLP